jgi:hypothetical protein
MAEPTLALRYAAYAALAVFLAAVSALAFDVGFDIARRHTPQIIINIGPQ